MNKRLFAVVAVAIGLLTFGAACVQFSKNTNDNTLTGPNIVATPSPSPSPSASPSPQAGDNKPSALGIFCYGFGAVSPQPEPNHGACRLPNGYPEIAVTCSPKNAAGVDIPQPTQNVTWKATITPPTGATFAVAPNPFNGLIQPFTTRVETSVLLECTYVHSDGTTLTASKTATIAPAGAASVIDGYVEAVAHLVRGRWGR